MLKYSNNIVIMLKYNSSRVEVFTVTVKRHFKLLLLFMVCILLFYFIGNNVLNGIK